MAAGIMIPTKDKYDEAVDLLRQNPDKITAAWCSPRSNPGGCLFELAKRSDGELRETDGCLTMIRSYDSCVYENEALTKEIRDDTRIPNAKENLTPDNLPVFAEWQRLLDKELHRV